MLALVVSGLGIASASSLTLVDALGIAERSNASLQAVIARQDAARAASITARQLPNPDVEVVAGPVRPRSIGGPDGHSLAVNLGQPLDYAGLRAVRARLADLGGDGAEAAVRTVRRSLYASVRVHFYLVLQRQEQSRIAEEELLALQQIRERVNLRVQLGEAPRLDLIRADTEVLNARRNRDSSVVRVEQARGALASLIGMPPGELPRVEGALPALAAVPIGYRYIGSMAVSEGRIVYWYWNVDYVEFGPQGTTFVARMHARAHARAHSRLRTHIRAHSLARTRTAQ